MKLCPSALKTAHMHKDSVYMAICGSPKKGVLQEAGSPEPRLPVIQANEGY